MAKTGFWLRGARGKFAGAAFQKGPKGSTVQREVVTPKNPKTRQQLIQRAIMATVMNGYSALKDICDHSFEGVTYGADSMYMFNKLNAKKLRAKVAGAAAINQIAGCCAFTKLGTGEIAPAEFIVSKGTLPTINYSVGYKGINCINLDTVAHSADNPTYQEVADGLGLQRGDQLTFVTLITDDNGKLITKNVVVILDPVNADGTPADFSTTFASNGIQSPNPGNKNTDGFEIAVGAQDSEAVHIRLENDIVAAAVIASRREGNDWLRSDATMAVNYFINKVDYTTILQAIANQYEEIQGESDYLLNGAIVSAENNAFEFSISINNGTPTNDSARAIDGNLTSIKLIGCASAGVAAAKTTESEPAGQAKGTWAVSGNDLVWSGTIEPGTYGNCAYVTLMGYPVIRIVISDDGE